MAETLVTNAQAHYGTTAERTAMVTTYLRHGATFEESDTPNIYKWDGSNWNIL